MVEGLCQIGCTAQEKRWEWSRTELWSVTNPNWGVMLWGLTVTGDRWEMSESFSEHPEKVDVWEN